MNDLRNLHVAEDVTTLPRPSTDYLWVHDSQLDLLSVTQHASSTECQLFWCVSVTWYVITSSSISSLKPIGNVSRVKCKCWYSNLQVGNGHANPCHEFTRYDVFLWLRQSILPVLSRCGIDHILWFGGARWGWDLRLSPYSEHCRILKIWLAQTLFELCRNNHPFLQLTVCLTKRFLKR
jgi:hypothetical protein